MDQHTKNTSRACRHRIENAELRAFKVNLARRHSNRTVHQRILTWKYHWVFSLSDGVPRAFTMTVRGLVRSAIRRMMPPFPAASLPSKMVTTRRPGVWATRKLVKTRRSVSTPDRPGLLATRSLVKACETFSNYKLLVDLGRPTFEVLLPEVRNHGLQEHEMGLWQTNFRHSSQTPESDDLVTNLRT
jgi:hypothetical protein